MNCRLCFVLVASVVSFSQAAGADSAPAQKNLNAASASKPAAVVASPTLAPSRSATAEVRTRPAAKTVPEMQAELAALNQQIAALDQQIAALEAKIAAARSKPAADATRSSRATAEVSMVDLQALVAKRANLVQLATGLINAINESTKAVAKNIGR